MERWRGLGRRPAPGAADPLDGRHARRAEGPRLRPLNSPLRTPLPMPCAKAHPTTACPDFPAARRICLRRRQGWHHYGHDDMRGLMSAADVLVVNYALHYSDFDMAEYEREMRRMFEQVGEFARTPGKAFVFRETAAEHKHSYVDAEELLLPEDERCAGRTQRSRQRTALRGRPPCFACLRLSSLACARVRVAADTARPRPAAVAPRFGWQVPGVQVPPAGAEGQVHRREERDHRQTRQRVREGTLRWRPALASFLLLPAGRHASAEGARLALPAPLGPGFRT